MTIVKCSDLIGRLEPEGEQELPREIQVERNERLEIIIDNFKKFAKKRILRDTLTSDTYDLIGEYLKKLGFEIRASDVLEFSQALWKYTKFQTFDSKAGLYVTRMIDESEDENFVVTLDEKLRLELFGFRNRKNIKVIGNVGYCCGKDMEKGIINISGGAESNLGLNMKQGTIIVGSAGDWVGNQIRDGKIIVNGNAGSAVGHKMLGGVIEVNGDTRLNVGEGMLDGEIYLNGNYTLSPNICGGKIYHKGKLIVSGGKRI